MVKNTTPETGLWRDWLLLGLMTLLVWLPLPLGSNRPVFWSLAEVAIAVLLIGWCIAHARGRRSVPETARRAWPLLALLAVWCIYVGAQMLPLPLAWIDGISPASAGLHRLIPGIDPDAALATLSVDPFGTEVALHKSLAYLGLVTLVLLLVDSHTRLRRVALALVTAGAVQAALAFVDLHTGSTVNGGFANRNHMANHVGLTIAAGLGLLLASMGGKQPAHLRARVRGTLDWMMSSKMRLRLALLLMAAAIILTQSRMGNVAFFGGMTIAGIAMLALSRQRTRGMLILLASIIVIDLAVVGTLIGAERVVERLEQTALADETRDEVARDTLGYWRDFPLTGSGLGSFYVTYPRYKQGDVPLFYRQAHNDYLQFGAETGVIGLTLLAAIVLLSLWQALKALRLRRDPLAQGIAFAVVMAVATALIHATAEFNLQIFANTATFLTLLALGWIGLHLPRERARAATGPLPSTRSRLVALAACGLLFGYLSWIGATLAAQLITEDSARLVKQWSADGAAPAVQVRKAMRRQVQAIALAPRNAEAKLMLARITWWQSGQGAPGGPPSAETGAQMLYALLTAARDNPGLAATWAAIAKVKYLRRDFDAVFQVALERMAALAPWEGHVQLTMASIGLDAWDDLRSDTQRRLVADAVARGLVHDESAMRELVASTGRANALCAEFVDRKPPSLCAAGPADPAPRL